MGNLTQISGQFKDNLFYYLIIHIIEKTGAVMLIFLSKSALSFFSICKDLTWKIILILILYMFSLLIIFRNI